jgi:nicotinate-nucleotide--dimethylbenzimidazole phosphoribosyltransferase
MTNRSSSPPPGSPAAGSPAEQAVADLVSAIDPVDSGAAAAARDRDRRLTKPPGSLGRIEELGFRLAAMAATPVPPAAEPGVVLVFAADHGVHAEGVSPWPQAVTAQMVANLCAGGAAVNVIARANDLEVRVVNVGVANALADHERLCNRPVRAGTGNLRIEAAMTRDEAARAVLVGAEIGMAAVDGGARCLLTGDMGIANTTASAAVVAAFTGRTAAEMTGRGTGIDDATLAHKVVVVRDALARIAGPATAAAALSGRPGHRGGSSGRDLAGVPAGIGGLDPLGVLAEIGGLEIAALTGLCLAGAASRTPVVVDGVIALAGALVACALQPRTAGYLLAGHRSVEPAATAALDHLGLQPLLELELRLGEGSGAALAYPLVRAAARLAREMATFDDAGVASESSGGT